MASDWEPDELAPEDFAALVAPLFEDAPAFIGRLAGARPFEGWERCFEAGTVLALAMPEADQLELIDAHPRIGAPPGSVSALSFVEQGYDRDVASTEAEAKRTRIAAELERLNRAYESAFGFRYVIFVAGRPRAAIVPLMEAALQQERESEKERALRDVVAIARDRAVKTGLMTDHTAT